MIVFDLKCRKDHVFEAWFADSETYETQVAEGTVQCPMCGDKKVSKAPMAPNVAVTKGRNEGPPQQQQQQQGRPQQTNAYAHGGGPTPQQAVEAMRMLRKVREVVEKNFDHVGERFPEEARKIHYGEVEKRNIYGDASPDEARELVDEGIEVSQIPWPSRHDA